MVVTRRLCQTLILGVALFYGVGECILFTTYNDSLYCSDVVCFPLRILNVTLLNLSCPSCKLCTSSTSSTIIAQQIKNKSETFFNQQCLMKSTGLAYSKSYIVSACTGQWNIRGIQVTYNCSSTTTATQIVERTTTFFSNGSLGFTTSDAANGSRDGKPTSSPNTDMIGGGAVAAAVCTSIGTFVIVFIAVYLWRRKLWKKCLPNSKGKDRIVLSPKSSSIGKPAREFCEHIYENGNTSRPKRPAVVIKAAASQGDASSGAKKCNDNSTEDFCADAPCYLDILPADSHHEHHSQDSRGVRFSALPNVPDKKDKGKQENYYSSPSDDSAYFVLEQSSVDPSTSNSLNTTSLNQRVVEAETDEYRGSAEPETFESTQGNNRVSLQANDLVNADDDMYVLYAEPGEA